MAGPAPPTVKTTAAKASKKPGLKPDLATLGGIALAMLGIIGGLLLEHGSIADVAQTTAAMIVMGGTFGAVLVTTPLPVFRRAFKGLGSAFFERGSSIPAMIETLIGYATKA